jgi:NADH dehydrogenase [ubiquinone] 1 alpha subcomplex assembly factor 7
MSTPLEEKILRLLRTNGPITVAEYMETCLYDPEHGYYTHASSLGREGDFVTAPMLTNLFGSAVAIWVARTWEHCGCPTPFILAEGGPGTGVLMKDMLTALPAACRAAAQPWLLEISPALEKTQRKTLAGEKVRWAQKLDDLPPDAPIIFVANELLDAFPIRQFGQDGDEQMVQEQAGRLAFTLPLENLLETHEATVLFLQNLRQRACAALLIDYGYVKGSGGGTLQAIYQHQRVPVFHRPGKTDLTAHVDFGEASTILGRTNTVTDLAPFLLNHGFASLAATALDKAPNQAARTAIEGASARLLAPNAMGQLFKVLAWNRGT